MNDIALQASSSSLKALGTIFDVGLIPNRVHRKAHHRKIPSLSKACEIDLEEHLEDSATIYDPKRSSRITDKLSHGGNLGGHTDDLGSFKEYVTGIYEELSTTDVL